MIFLEVLAAACWIFYTFWKLMKVVLDPRLDWDVSPLALMFLTVLDVRRKLA